ncbi:co-chaperone GroES, partial [bacterium AH-315-M10]|nr:co-chaperone GroES [bacterium AH-315-M10]
MADITPIGDKVLIKRLDAEQTTKGGIVLPDTAQEKPKQGSVVALGDGKRQKDGSRA